VTEILLHIATADGAPVAAGLARACERAGISWSCFLTNDGVRVLADPAFAAALRSAARAEACEHSWKRYMGAAPCSIALGSQTSNSALMAEARHVISL
jgi:hypothetical protein